MKKYNTEEFISQLRNTKLQGIPHIYPYEKSKISLQKFSKDDLYPTSFYCLKSQINELIVLNAKLRNAGYNIFNLDGYVSFEDIDIFAITPPIIEVVQGKPLIVDGLHRVLLSDAYNEKIQCVVIENAEPITYAVANPHKWEDVKQFEERVPAGFKTRNHRYGDDYKRYTRIFDLDGIAQLPREHNKSYQMQILKGIANGR